MRLFIEMLVCLMILFSPTSCNNKKHQLNLQIVDEKNLQGLPYASVEINSDNFSYKCLSDISGKVDSIFLLDNSYKLTVEAVGHYTLSDYAMTINSNSTIRIELKPVELKKAEVDWKGGWITIENDDGTLKTVRAE